jgi:hypothetical protein
MTTLLLGKRAMFVLQEPGKPQVNSGLLQEGEKDPNITNLEVKEIDAKAGTVRVVFGGKELTLNFNENGIKPPTGPAPAPPGSAVGGKPPMVGAGGGIPPPPIPPASAQFGVGAQRTLQPGTAIFTADSASGGLRPIPTRPTRLGSAAGTSWGNPAFGATQPEPPPQLPGASAEQVAAVQALQTQEMQRHGIEMPPALPIPGAHNPVTEQGQNQPRGYNPGTYPPVPGPPIPLPPIPGNQ